jgi:hypothetical protein
MRSALSLLAPMLTPTMPRLRSRLASRSSASAAIVEAHAVDDGAIFGQPKKARARVAGLRQRRQRADLHKTEAHAEHRRKHLGVLVEAGGEADRRGKAEAGDAGGKAGGEDRWAAFGQPF